MIVCSNVLCRVVRPWVAVIHDYALVRYSSWNSVSVSAPAYSWRLEFHIPGCLVFLQRSGILALAVWLALRYVSFAPFFRNNDYSDYWSVTNFIGFPCTQFLSCSSVLTTPHIANSPLAYRFSMLFNSDRECDRFYISAYLFLCLCQSVVA